jgi:hypothetical protein
MLPALADMDAYLAILIYPLRTLNIVGLAASIIKLLCHFG